MSLPGLWLAPGLYSVYLKLLASSFHAAGRYDSERIMLEVKGGIDGTGRTILAPDVEWKLETANVAETILSHPNGVTISSGSQP